jgi:hypothetical protein
MVAKLVTIGDSLTQGFQSAAIRRTEASYPAMLAPLLGATPFRQPDFSGGGVGGPLVDLELLLRRLSDACGGKLDLLEIPKALLTVRSFMDSVEDYWERKEGTAASATGPLHHNLAVWGFELLDALTLSDAVCRAQITPPLDNFLNQIPEFGMYRTARRTLNPQKLKDFESFCQLDAAQRLAAEEGGIETLMVALGANNVLGVCTQMALRWSEPSDLQKLSHDRQCTIWRPEHFAALYGRLVTQIAALGARHTFLATVPHVTVPPVTRGVSPIARVEGKAELSDGYYEYYTRFWIWDRDFDPYVHPHFTRADAREIDATIDAYNATIRAAAAAHGFHVVDLCAVLDTLAFRRLRGHPRYSFPAGLIGALRQNPATRHRVRPDGTVLLDTRFLRLPSTPPAEGAPSEHWQHAYQGGLFGLDGAHPTTIGYGIIAHETLRAMQQAGVAGAEPDRLPWPEIVAKDTLVQNPPAILSSLQATANFLFGSLGLDKLVEQLAGFGTEKI